MSIPALDVQAEASFIAESRCFSSALRRLISGPKYEQIQAISSHAHILLCNLAFAIFEVPFYWSRYTPAVGLVHLLVFAASWALLFLAEFTDPGIIPRMGDVMVGNLSEEKSPDPNAAVENSVEVAIPDASSTDSESQLTKKPSLYTYADNDRRYRWCNTCHIWRPPKASHCSICDNCVKGFDQ